MNAGAKGQQLPRQQTGMWLAEERDGTQRTTKSHGGRPDIGKSESTSS